MKKLNASILTLAATSATVALLAGCHAFGDGSSRRRATSVVSYLYPRQSEPVETPGVPVLTLPLKVGVAFVPEDNERHGFVESGPLSESQRVALIDEVSASFKKLRFVKSIEVIPSAYLRPKGSFANLQQLHNAILNPVAGYRVKCIGGGSSGSV